MHFSARLQCLGKRGDHAEHGALAGISHCLARRLRADPHRQRKLRGRHGHAVTKGARRADQELREDRTRVATAAINRVFAHPTHQLTDTGHPTTQCTTQHAAQGKRQIAAGIAVSHREYIDPVQGVAVGNHMARAANQGKPQAGPTYGSQGTPPAQYSASLSLPDKRQR